MGYKNKLDMHIHTANSYDGSHSAIRMCEMAMKKNLRSLTFTDHCEVDIYEKGNFEIAMTHAFVEVAKAKSAFMGTLLINNGIELGQPVYDKEKAEHILNKFEYDQVIGSVHNLRNRPDFYFIDYSEVDVDSLLDEYFYEIFELVKWDKFDTLAHLTYPLRYIVGQHNIQIDLNKFSPKIDEILKLLAKNEKALEINTSGLRQPLGKTMPDEDIIKRFKQLGGEIITIGSDAHNENDVGAGIEEGMALAKKCGFNEIALFQKRTPIPIPIE